jgi:hypothetical protein
MVLNIKEWTIAYLKYKDSVLRKIVSIVSSSDNSLIVKFKDSEIKYLCVDELASLELESLKTCRVSCLNTKKNFDWVINNWNFLKDTDTMIFFANPSKAQHWSVVPKTHNNITEKTVLKSGLKSLFDSIPEV